MKGLRAFMFHIRYAHRLYSRSDLTWREAWRYPLPWGDFTTGDPVEDADVELSYWDED